MPPMTKTPGKRGGGRGNGRDGTSSRGQGSQGGRGKRGAGSRPGWLPIRRRPRRPAGRRPARRRRAGSTTRMRSAKLSATNGPSPAAKNILQLLAEADGLLTGETIAAQLGWLADRVEALGAPGARPR